MFTETSVVAPGRATGPGLHFVLGGLTLGQTLLLFQISLKFEIGTLSLEIIGVVDNAFIPPIRATSSIRLPHQIGAFFVLHDIAAEIFHAVGDDCSTLKGPVFSESVFEILSWRGSDGFHVGVVHGGSWRVFFVSVATGKSSIKRSAMVIGTANGVQRINNIGLRNVLAPEVGRTVGGAGLLSENFKRTVGHVARKAL